MSQKIVINSCFGGFSLSPKAIKRMAELQGRNCYFFKSSSFGGEGYSPITLEETESHDSLFFSAFDIPNPNEVLKNEKTWHEMTFQERQDSNALYEKHSLDDREIARNSPLLIQVVEELGEEANGRCADLSIVEIPDGVDWQIEEYDGNEHIAEKHQTWS